MHSVTLKISCRWKTLRSSTTWGSIPYIVTKPRHYCGCQEVLADCYQNSLKLAAEHGIKRIAFPSISTGIYAFPVERAAKIAIDTVDKFLKENSELFDMVLWVLFDNKTEAVYRKVVQRIKNGE